MRLMILLFAILSLINPVIVQANSLSAEAPVKGSAHVGLNPGVPDGREGGETVADALPIPGLPFTDTGNTTDNIHDYDEACPYTGSISPDVVYSYSPANDNFLFIDLCDSDYDTKVYVYENAVTPGVPIACNDDADCAVAYRSQIEFVEVIAGNIYYIVIDGYGGDAGDYTLFIEEILPPPPCELECPAGAILEGEPPLEDEYVDNYNGGCGSSPYAFQPLGSPILCAISGWYDNLSRDTDWFTVIADSQGFITARAHAEYDLYLFVLLPMDCSSVGIVYDVICQCEEPGVIEFAHPAGTPVWLWSGPTEFSGPVDEFDYILTVDGIEYDPPSATENDSWGGIKAKFAQ